MRQLANIFQISLFTAFSFASHNIQAYESYAPIFSSQQGQQEVVVPAITMDNNKAGELVIGQTTIDEALAILPPYPWPGQGTQKKQEKQAGGVAAYRNCPSIG